MGLSAGAGTTGYGIDFNVGLLDRLSTQIGYSTLSYNRTLDHTGVTYDGELKSNNLSGVLNWYVFGGGFHLSGGAFGGGLKVDATGQPSPGGIYQIGHGTYTSAEISSLTGQVKFASSLAPYVGLGWGNPIGTGRRVHFLFDVGAIYGGTPGVSLTATCAAPSGSPQCTQLQKDVAVEQQKLQDSVSSVKWYPVVNLALAYRF